MITKNTLISLLVSVVCTQTWAGNVTAPNTFVDGTTASASEVNENFDAVATEVNDNDNRIGTIETGVKENDSRITLNASEITAVRDALSYRVYGDGVEGDLDMPNIDRILQSNTRQFDNCIIRSGFTLTVDSGTVIRCRGGFINEGTIVVETFAQGGTIRCARESVPASAGQSRSIAGFPACNNAYRNAAPATIGIVRPRTATNLLEPGPRGGGGGSGRVGGGGGGTLTIMAGGPLVNSGEILANGESSTLPGSGGGGGGIVILASGESILNGGMIRVRGGDGASATALDEVGPGGGGGGGIVHLISPLVTSFNSNYDVTGGVGGGGGETLSTSSNGLIIPGGGAGGACWGNGGAGGDIDGSGLIGDASSGSNGAALITLADPLFYF